MPRRYLIAKALLAIPVLVVAFLDLAVPDSSIYAHTRQLCLAGSSVCVALVVLWILAVLWVLRRTR